MGRGQRALVAVAAIWLAWAGYAIFIVAPMERTMRELQRIFYIHAASGLVGLIAFFGSFLASVGYLASRQDRWDWWKPARCSARWSWLPDPSGRARYGVSGGPGMLA